MTYILLSEEKTSINLKQLHDRIKVGVSGIPGLEDTDVVIRNNGVFWTLSRTVNFIVRIHDAVRNTRDAKDFAILANHKDTQQKMLECRTIFTCHNQDSHTDYQDEFYFLLSVLNDGHESWCFCLDSNQYISIDYDKKRLLEKERHIQGLNYRTPSGRSVVTRIFYEPLPIGIADEEQFLTHVVLIPHDFLEYFSQSLIGRSYEEVRNNKHGKEFVYIPNKRWSLRVNLTEKEIYFSLPSTKFHVQSALFEAYQCGAEIIGDGPLRIYDAKGDHWLRY